MSEIDDLLNTDTVKEVIDKVSGEVDDIEGLIVGYTTKQGSLKWRMNTTRSHGLGIVEIIRHDLLNLDLDIDQ